MNILLACQQSPVAYPIPSYGFWRRYFVNGLVEAGHTVHEVAGADWARGLLPLPADEHARWLGDAWERTLSTARALRDSGRLDLFLGYLYPGQIDVSAVRSLRSLGIPAVNFFCDNIREYHRLPARFAPFDLHWVPEYAALPLYAARGWPALHAPMPCWVPPARRHPPESERLVASFIGGRDPLRADLLARAAAAGLPLEIRGPSWSSRPAPVPASPVTPPTLRARLADWSDFIGRQGLAAAARRATSRWRSDPEVAFDFTPFLHPSPSDEGYADILAGSAVSLGINRFPGFRHSPRKPGVYSRLRDIEAPMLGACYLTEHAPGLESLYEPGVEIETYRDSDELVAKCRALLADPARRARLRLAGQNRALRDHSLGRTVARIGGRLGLAAS